MTNSKRLFAITVLLAAFATSQAIAAETAPTAPPTQEQLAAALRDKLSAPIETALQEHCGEDCPSFKIDPQFKKAAADVALDDLGFSKPSKPDSAPEIQSVSVSVLIQDKVSQKSRDSLRKILSSRIANLANVPVTVRMMPLDAFGPVMERRMKPETASVSMRDKIELVKASAWPVCLILLAVLGMWALSRVLKHRRDSQKELLAAKTQMDQAASQAQPQTLDKTVDSSQIAELIQSRSEDLQWLIQDAASRSQVGMLRKLLAAFPAQELTSRIRFAPETLSVLASLPPSDEKSDAATALKWVATELERVHWSRLEEQANRLSRLKRLPAARLSKIFSRISTAGCKAAFVAALPEDRWPELLATLGSEERVQLGLRLADYAAATPEDRATLVNQLSQDLSRLDDSLATRSEAALESFSLYLSEKEGQKLWQELSVKAMARGTRMNLAPMSVDTVLGKMDASATTELCTRLDVGTLSVVLTQVSGETRAKIYQNLPKALQERLSSSAQSARAPGEAEAMKARVALMETYRAFSAGSATQ